jgi:hypothetical protein
MNNLTIIEPKVRALINDIEKTGTDLFTYTSSPIFILTEANVNDITSVSVNGTESGVIYTFNTSTNKITITSDLAVEDVIEIVYTYYSNYSINEIYSYISSALIHISANNFTTWIVEDGEIYPEPDDSECNLIASVTAILIKPDNISYRLPDMSIAVPKDLPTIDKIRKTISVFKHCGEGVFFLAQDDDIDIFR